jgi:3-oxoacyl-[acyl-carrier protein] reductase
MELTGALAVVTGATEGIGRAIALELGRAGAKVAICARTGPNVQTTLDDLRAAGIDAVGARCDVSDPKDVQAFAAFVTEQRGVPQIVVNNAGIGRFQQLEDLSLDDWDLTMSVNVRSLFLVTRAFLAEMKRLGRGTIVNIASLAGRNGFEGGTAYCASKHAVLGFSKALMLEVRKHNLRVVAVCPGSVATPFMDKQSRMRPNRDRVLTADDVARTVHAALTLSDRAMVSELDIRPTNP